MIVITGQYFFCHRLLFCEGKTWRSLTKYLFRSQFTSSRSKSLLFRVNRLIFDCRIVATKILMFMKCSASAKNRTMDLVLEGLQGLLLMTIVLLKSSISSHSSNQDKNNFGLMLCKYQIGFLFFPLSTCKIHQS